ncbi:chemotaxis protein CheW [Zooshikella harenae]|uniref:Chemotaxis protein CheW n=1 Tax=Zooshikella harenae TaxID=2827238 RepID=A0ABS5Z8R3_9GAMM|nr:chemotaxis protein CheW [Zooshikella harenae]MBU2710426.1 chemotaxis protein CheW [Zooshikella harenae]
MTQESSTQNLSKSTIVVKDYLDHLLQEVSWGEGLVDIETEPEVVSEAKIDPATDTVDVLSQDEVQIEDEVQTVEPELAPKTVVQECETQALDCLLFSVGGLRLAVPLTELGTVLSVNDYPLTTLVGKPSWFLGVFHYQQQTYNVIDTAQCIMPERYKININQAIHYLLVIDNSTWVLAVDNVHESITLSPREIRWRKHKGNRPWLAGTVIAKMCALLNIKALALQLNSQIYSSP